MTEDPVLLEHRDGIAIVTLNRPDTGNAIDLEVAEALSRVAIECDRNHSVRAVLLRANGRFFCVGGSVDLFAGAGDKAPALLLQLAGLLHAAVSRLSRMEKPLVTAVQGSAAGAGFSLGILGDIVVAARSAQFSVAYPAIGFTPDGGASWLLPRIIGMRRAQRLMLLNPRMSAEVAYEEGLITEVVDDADLDQHTFDLAAQLAKGPTRAYGRTKSLLLSSLETGLESQLELEARAIAASIATRDGQEGVSAFVEKRRPNFSGD